MDKVVHFEIPAANLNRAKTFYKNIFGWKIKDVPNMDYALIYTVAVDKKYMPKTAGAINGGMMMRDKTAKTPIFLISVASIDKYLKKIEAKGGKTTLPKQTVGEMGFYARFTDPEGNTVGLWENTGM